jgi:hypothetical protein
MLEEYSDIDPQRFKSRSLELLVGCIDFVTAKSKKTRKPENYVRQVSWKAFLGSDIKKVSWKQLSEERNANRVASDNENLDKEVNRAATRLKNLIKKYGKDEINRKLTKNHVLNLPDNFVSEFDEIDALDL